MTEGEKSILSHLKKLTASVTVPLSLQFLSRPFLSSYTYLCAVHISQCAQYVQGAHIYPSVQNVE